MIILGKPRNTKRYIAISDENMNKELQTHNFFPLYWDSDTNIMYYKNNVELKEYLQKVGEKIE